MCQDEKQDHWYIKGYLVQQSTQLSIQVILNVSFKMKFPTALLFMLSPLTQAEMPTLTTLTTTRTTPIYFTTFSTLTPPPGGYVYNGTTYTDPIPMQSWTALTSETLTTVVPLASGFPIASAPDTPSDENQTMENWIHEILCKLTCPN